MLAWYQYLRPLTIVEYPVKDYIDMYRFPLTIHKTYVLSNDILKLMFMKGN